MKPEAPSAQEETWGFVGVVDAAGVAVDAAVGAAAGAVVAPCPMNQNPANWNCNHLPTGDPFPMKRTSYEEFGAHYSRDVVTNAAHSCLPPPDDMDW